MPLRKAHSQHKFTRTDREWTAGRAWAPKAKPGIKKGWSKAEKTLDRFDRVIGNKPRKK